MRSLPSSWTEEAVTTIVGLGCVQPSKRAADCGTPARGGKHFGRVKSSELGGHDSTAADIAMASCSLPQLRAPTPLLGAVPTASRRPRRAVGRPTRALKDKHESATPPRRTRNLHIVDGKLPLFGMAAPFSPIFDSLEWPFMWALVPLVVFGVSGIWSCWGWPQCPTIRHAHRESESGRSERVV